MAKNGKRVWHRAKQVQIPVAIVAGFAPMALKLWEAKNSGFSGFTRELSRITVGFDPWNGMFIPGAMRYGTFPALLGFAIHWGANKLGVNRALSNAGIPFIRV